MVKLHICQILYTHYAVVSLISHVICSHLQYTGSDYTNVSILQMLILHTVMDLN